MSGLFDIPTGLLFVLSLVTSSPNGVATAATGMPAPKAATTLDLKSSPCRYGEQAWFSALKDGGGSSAFPELGQRIFMTSGGRYYVPADGHRRQILGLRRDNAVSCFVALSAAATNAKLIKAALGRDAELSDLYLAHVFGAETAVKVLTAIAVSPRKRMIRQFPHLDQVAPGLYRGPGQAMTLLRFSARLDDAIRRRIETATGTRLQSAKVRRTAPLKAPPIPKKVKTEIVPAKLSARDINRHGTVTSSALYRVPVRPVRVTRFDFATGLQRIAKGMAVQTPVIINKTAF